MTMNAYLGARPIAAALAAGADIVVTGRSVDSSVVLGPLMHEFGWQDTDYDLLVGRHARRPRRRVRPPVHGRQLHRLGHRARAGTTWATRSPSASRTARAIITKPENTGGLVSPATVGEQIVYEIGDPGAYVMPDVVCDWRDVRLERSVPTASASAARKGSAAADTYKVTATHADGYRVMTTAMFSGIDAGGKARRAGEALIARAERLIGAAGLAPLTESSVEVIGAGDTFGPDHRVDARHRGGREDRRRGTRRRRRWRSSPLEYAPMALVGAGHDRLLRRAPAGRARRSASTTCWSGSPP